MSHKELVKIAYGWCERNASCGVVFKELYNSYGEIPDVIGFGAWHSTLIECKSSRSDFLCDAKKPHRKEGKGMGNYRYYCCPSRLIKECELPAGWGLIYISPKGKPTCIVNPKTNDLKQYYKTGQHSPEWHFSADKESEQRYLYCALRRINVRGGLGLAYALEKQSNNDKLETMAVVANEGVLSDNNVPALLEADVA